MLDKEWPIKDWFEKKQYKIKRNNNDYKVTIKQRKLFWSRLLVENNSVYILSKDKMLNKSTMDCMQAGFIPNSKNVVSFIINDVKREIELPYSKKVLEKKQS